MLELIKLKGELQKHFKHISLKITDLFTYTTIKSLAKFIKDGKDTFKSENLNVSKTNILDYSIAVIGMSGMFSGSDNIKEYWKTIISGQESLDKLSKD